MLFFQNATRKLRFLIFLLKISDKIWLFQTNTLSLRCVFHSIRFKVNNYSSQRRAFFYVLYDTHNPSSPDLSQNTIPVATTQIRIWLIPYLCISFSFIHLKFVSFFIFVLGYWLFGLLLVMN